MSQLPPLNTKPQHQFTDYDDLPQTRREDSDERPNFWAPDNGSMNTSRLSGDQRDLYAIDESSSDAYKKNFLFDNYKPRHFSDEEIETCFQSFDLSDTGFLSSAEIKRCFQSLNANVTDQEVDEMLRMCDTSGDGQVEYDEFQAMIYKQCGIKRSTKTFARRNSYVQLHVIIILIYINCYVIVLLL